MCAILSTKSVSLNICIVIIIIIHKNISFIVYWRLKRRTYLTQLRRSASGGVSSSSSSSPYGVHRTRAARAHTHILALKHAHTCLHTHAHARVTYIIYYTCARHLEYTDRRTRKRQAARTRGRVTSNLARTHAHARVHIHRIFSVPPVYKPQQRPPMECV